jgi:hypothetical protein
MDIVVEHEEREDVERVPICDEPYRFPSSESSIPEIHYKMENRMYIENAD